MRSATDLEVRLLPESRVAAAVGDPYAFCLALDARGTPLPLPVDRLVSTADGVLTATRMSAGRYTLLVQSAEGARYATRDLTLGEGERRSVHVDLTVDPVGASRFLAAVGGSATLHPLHPEEGKSGRTF